MENNISESGTETKCLWSFVVDDLKQAYGESIFKSWISGLSFIGTESGKLLISAPTKFIREWVLVNYSGSILNTWRRRDNSIYYIEISVDSNVNKASSDAKKLTVFRGKIDSIKNVNKYDVLITKDDFGNYIDPRCSFSNFIVGKSNDLAFRSCVSVSESMELNSGSNPLFLYSGVGLGKTHLMYATIQSVKKNFPSKKVLYLSAEGFMRRFIAALRSNAILQFKDLLRSADFLLIDDIQFIGGKDHTQEEFFHTFNTLINENKQVIISADRAPNCLSGIDDRIKSRLSWGLVIDIDNTTYELRSNILKKKIDNLGYSNHINEDVIDFIALNVTNNVRELEGAINRLIANSKLRNVPITINLAEETLSDLVRSTKRTVSIDQILKIISSHFSVSGKDLISSKRHRSISRPRQIGMYLSKVFTICSLPEIGRRFGGKDHSTVIHAVSRISDLVKTDKKIESDIASIIQKIKGLK